MRSLGSDVGDAHVPEEADAAHEEHLVFDGHEPEIYGGSQRPDLPTVVDGLPQLLPAHLHALPERAHVAVAHHLESWVERSVQQRSEQQLVEKHAVQHVLRLRNSREQRQPDARQHLAVPEVEDGRSHEEIDAEKVHVALQVELALLDDCVGEKVPVWQTASPMLMMSPLVMHLVRMGWRSSMRE